MTKILFLKSGVILSMGLILGACASISDKFPEYGNSVRKHSIIPVVLDLFVYRDIAGQNRGINPTVNATYLEDAISEVELALTERGFSIGQVITTSGLTHEIKTNIDYVISEDWKSTGTPYDLQLTNQEKNLWHSDEAKKLFSMIFRVAEEINQSNGRDQAYAQKKVIDEASKTDESTPLAISEIELPTSLFDDLDSDVVLLVSIDAKFQKLSKYLTKGLLVGAMSNALTGGLVVVPPGSYAVAKVVAFNTKTREILWYNRDFAEGKNSINTAVEYALKRYPYSDGETLFEKKVKEKRARRAR